MSSIDGIPSYVLQNMSIVQENIKDIMADNLGVGGAKGEFDSFLNSAVGDIASTFSDAGFEDGVRYQDSAYGNTLPGVSGNVAKPSDIAQIMNQQLASNKNTPNAESTAAINKAYQSLLNGEMANNLSPEISSIENKSLNDLKKLKGNNTSLITDEEFFDAEALSPSQITDILKKKGSPYAYRTYEGGKSIGQLIYDECHKAGTVAQGSHTINPAMIISIMGAESSFGTDPKAFANNPFNIRVNGSFANVNNFEQSLNMAVNTMYNWAIDRPKDSKVSLLDYAGDKYCEDYTKEWKPNVEKHFLDFTARTSETGASLGKAETDQKQKLISQIASSFGSLGGAGKNGMNIEALMKMAGGNSNSAIMSAMGAGSSEANPMMNINNLSMLSSLNSAASTGDENKDE